MRYDGRPVRTAAYPLGFLPLGPQAGSVKGSFVFCKGFLLCVVTESFAVCLSVLCCGTGNLSPDGVGAGEDAMSEEIWERSDGFGAGP